MARKSTIKLLLINESDNEGERLISLFRNAGRVARAHRAISAEDLHNMLEQESWDLLIANDKHPEIAIDQCLEQLKKSGTNLPAIVIRDEDVQAALEAGASDVVSIGDDQRLIFAAFREINHIAQYRELALVKEKLADAEERCALLMDQSDDAIAYVADGMLVSANPLFCNRFGYDDADDLDCAPVIDLIDESDQEKFKRQLKTQIGSTDENSTTININGRKQAGEIFSTSMQLSNAVFDDEPCIQISIKDQLTTATNGSAGATLDHDPNTGLYSHDYFLSQLESMVAQASAGTISTLFFIGIDKFTSFRSRLGITCAYNIVLDIARLIQQQTEENNCLAHFCDDGFTLLLPETNAEKALTYAQSLCQKLEEHIIEIDNQSIQCTVSIGLVELNNQIQGDPNQLVECAFNTCEQVRHNTNQEGMGNDAAIYVPIREKKSLGDASNDEDLDQFLAEALEDNQFSLSFQPVVSLRGSSGDHYEVLISMLNDEGEEEPANDYLKKLQFEQPNTRLDRWIILEATKQLSAQIERNHDIRLFINLTPNALQDDTLIPWLNVALKAGGIPGSALTFQFIESDITDYLKHAKSFSESIKDVGCNLSIANFGQLDDPFKVLKQVNAGFVKIAEPLTTCLQDGSDTQMLKALVNSINENESKAIISAVENAAALAVLWQIGVDYIQGNYLAGPSKHMDYEFTDIA